MRKGPGPQAVRFYLFGGAEGGGFERGTHTQSASTLRHQQCWVAEEAGVPKYAAFRLLRARLTGPFTLGEHTGFVVLFCFFSLFHEDSYL